MLRKLCIIAFILALTVLSWLVWIDYTSGKVETPPQVILAQSEVVIADPVPQILPYTIPSGLSAKTLTILTDLISCESGGNPVALNKIDRDGTPSYGLLQFKPDTFKGAMALVDKNFDKTTWLTSIYNPNLQIKAFLAMYGDGKPVSWWQSQFPDCSKKQGYWLDL